MGRNTKTCVERRLGEVESHSLGLSRINVLFVLFLYGMGGSERLVHNLVSRIDKDRFRGGRRLVR